MKLLGVTPKGSKAQKAQQLRDSLGNAISTPGVTDVQLKVLSSWCLKPFKGSKDTRAGIKNESRIFSILPACLDGANYSDCPKITKLQVTQLRDVGLVESRGNANLTCSTDHICMLRIVWSSGEAHYYELAVCELKTRTKEETVAAELSVMSQDSMCEVFHVESKEDFHKYVREPENRVQNWHHVGSYGRRFSLYIIAKKDAILRFVLLEVSQDQREKYMHYMGVLWKTYMAPFESVATIPVEMKTADLGFLATHENLQFSIAHRIGLRKLVEQEGALPPARHMLDMLVALWNKTKGGTGQCSRAMEDLHGKWENFLSPTTRLTVRTLKTVFFQAKNAYCLLKVASGLLRGETTTYRQHLKKLSEVITLRRFVARCSNCMGDFMLSTRSRNDNANRLARPSPTSARNALSSPALAETPSRFTKKKTNELKVLFNLGKLKERRLKRGMRHRQVSAGKKDAGIPAGMIGKQHRCVVCCDRCTDVTGKVNEREACHAAVPAGNSPKPAFYRRGYKQSNLCVDCGFIPLCRSVRFHTPGAKSCWQIWHTEDDLMNGMGETLCNVQNPKLDLGLRVDEMSTKTKKSGAGITKSKAKNLSRNVSVTIGVKRKSNRGPRGKKSGIGSSKKGKKAQSPLQAVPFAI